MAGSSSARSNFELRALQNPRRIGFVETSFPAVLWRKRHKTFLRTALSRRDAQSRNRIQTSHFHPFPASRRTGGEVRGKPECWRQDQSGHDAGRGCPANATAKL